MKYFSNGEAFSRLPRSGFPRVNELARCPNQFRASRASSTRAEVKDDRNHAPCSGRGPQDGAQSHPLLARNILKRCNTESTTKDPILRVWEVLAAMGFSRTTLWRQVRDRKFPRPVEMAPNCVGWFASEVEAHRASLPRRTYGATTPASQPEPLQRDAGTGEK